MRSRAPQNNGATSALLWGRAGTGGGGSGTELACPYPLHPVKGWGLPCPQSYLYIRHLYSRAHSGATSPLCPSMASPASLPSEADVLWRLMGQDAGWTALQGPQDYLAGGGRSSLQG
ncbi:hypothetical protein NDU88_002216 [Pleurodeles waltl]|uniref:Uncharacterized protein n=1 Tax=Pleurodeles waltl TaxID=8319 RepID=A0AAV7M1S2_PLEWA|nr:hypothetical protein NDU88_002216 [Pleurodeles waltl]